MSLLEAKSLSREFKVGQGGNEVDNVIADAYVIGPSPHSQGLIIGHTDGAVVEVEAAVRGALEVAETALRAHTVAVATPGVYSALPANPVAVTGGAGTGATPSSSGSRARSRTATGTGARTSRSTTRAARSRCSAKTP